MSDYYIIFILLLLLILFLLLHVKGVYHVECSIWKYRNRSENVCTLYWRCHVPYSLTEVQDYEFLAIAKASEYVRFFCDRRATTDVCRNFLERFEQEFIESPLFRNLVKTELRHETLTLSIV